MQSFSGAQPVTSGRDGGNTDKKEKKIFLIYQEIQNGAGAKSYIYD
jgi:hypothetical protein